MADRMRSSLQLVIALLLITASVVVVDVAFAHQTPSSGEFFFIFLSLLSVQDISNFCFVSYLKNVD